MNENYKNIAVAWYRPNQWDMLLSCSEDADKLERTYQEWLDQAEKKIKEMKNSGFNVVRVDVDVEALIKWCREAGKPIDGAARSEYAMHVPKVETQKLITMRYSELGPLTRTASLNFSVIFKRKRI